MLLMSIVDEDKSGRINMHEFCMLVNEGMREIKGEIKFEQLSKDASRLTKPPVANVSSGDNADMLAEFAIAESAEKSLTFAQKQANILQDLTSTVARNELFDKDGDGLITIH